MSNLIQYTVLINILIDDSDDVWEAYTGTNNDFETMSKKLEQVVLNSNIETDLKNEYIRRLSKVNFSDSLRMLGMRVIGNKGKMNYPEVINIMVAPIKPL